MFHQQKSTASASSRRGGAWKTPPAVSNPPPGPAGTGPRGPCDRALVPCARREPRPSTGGVPHTGWDRYWGTDRYGTKNPFLTAAAADWLVERQAALVGIDSVNIDDTSGPARPVHTALLAAGIPIVEHLCGLDQLPATGFRFHAAPAPVVGIDTFPVRAYAVIADGRDLHVA